MRKAEEYFKKDSKTKEILKHFKGNKELMQKHYTFLQSGMCNKCRHKMFLLLKRGKSMGYESYCKVCQQVYNNLMKDDT